jgi:Tol biopolymer transport system component
MNLKKVVPFLLFAAFSSCLAQEAPVGSGVTPDAKEQSALNALKGTINGKIIWSSSRTNSKHDIWIMNADGTDPKQLTKGDCVDWYSRFSPSGDSVLFTRSKSGWDAENDAEVYDKWDLWIVASDGSSERKVADNACWGTWRPSGDSIVFARGAKVFLKSLNTGDEKEIFDAEKTIKKGVFSQQPQLSPDGKKLAITLRGSKRETVIWNLDSNQTYSTGGGCEMDWFPDGNRVIRVNEGQGNGGTEVLAIKVDANGKPIDKLGGLSLPKSIRFMDLPGRRSHEYFPKIDNTGNWMVWCATQYGHEHDIVDYEMYIWKIGTAADNAVRLTFNTGNDRWPDLFIAKK